MRYAPLLIALAIAAPVVHAAPLSDADADRLVQERGCWLCHRTAPFRTSSNEVPPTGPSWKDIAARYKGRPGMEDRLVETVLRGSRAGERRHWEGKASGGAMPQSAIEISADEARQLVRWILR